MSIYSLGIVQYLSIITLFVSTCVIIRYHNYKKNWCTTCCVDPSREANKALIDMPNDANYAIEHNNALMVGYCEILDKSQDGLKHENERLRKRLKDRHILLIPKRCMEEINDLH